jgi:hypothetical protein
MICIRAGLMMVGMGAQNVLLFDQTIWMFNTNNQGEDGVSMD